MFHCFFCCSAPWSLLSIVDYRDNLPLPKFSKFRAEMLGKSFITHKWTAWLLFPKHWKSWKRQRTQTSLKRVLSLLCGPHQFKRLFGFCFRQPIHSTFLFDKSSGFFFLQWDYSIADFSFSFDLIINNLETFTNVENCPV